MKLKITVEATITVVLPLCLHGLYAVTRNEPPTVPFYGSQDASCRDHIYEERLEHAGRYERCIATIPRVSLAQRSESILAQPGTVSTTCRFVLGNSWSQSSTWCALFSAPARRLRTTAPHGAASVAADVLAAVVPLRRRGPPADGAGLRAAGHVHGVGVRVAHPQPAVLVGPAHLRGRRGGAVHVQGRELVGHLPLVVPRARAAPQPPRAHRHLAAPHRHHHRRVNHRVRRAARVRGIRARHREPHD